jgi:prevent-host-death family protein
VAAVNVHDAKTHLSKLLDRAEAGEEIVIAKAGRPVAKLVPFTPPGPRRPGLLEGRVGTAFFEPLPEEELTAWETHLADAQAAVGPLGASVRAGRVRAEGASVGATRGAGPPKRAKRLPRP